VCKYYCFYVLEDTCSLTPSVFISTVPLLFPDAEMLYQNLKYNSSFANSGGYIPPETLQKMDTDEELWMPEFCSWQQMAVFN